VSPDNAPIEVARRANEMFSSVPFEDLRAAVLSAASYEEAAARLEKLGVSLDQLIDPQVEVDVGEFEGGGALAGGGGQGHEAWLRFWREWLEPWEGLTFEATSYDAIDGGHVLVDANVTARGRLGGVPAELSVCQLWTVREGRVTRYGVHPTRELAVAAIEAERGRR
jgi:hypothetical protein